MASLIFLRFDCVNQTQPQFHPRNLHWTQRKCRGRETWQHTRNQSESRRKKDLRIKNRKCVWSNKCIPSFSIRCECVGEQVLLIVESECGVCVCLCWNGLFCPTILPVRSFLSLSLSLTGRVGSCQCGRRSGRGLFMMGVFCFVLFFSPIFVSTSRNLFWVQWGSPSGRVRGWVYPLYPPLRLFSLFTSLSLAPRLPSSPSSSLPVRAAKQMPAKQPGALCPRVTSHLQFSPL